FSLYNEIHTAKPLFLSVKEPVSTNKIEKMGSTIRFYPRWGAGLAVLERGAAHCGGGGRGVPEPVRRGQQRRQGRGGPRPLPSGARPGGGRLPVRRSPPRVRRRRRGHRRHDEAPELRRVRG